MPDHYRLPMGHASMSADDVTERSKGSHAILEVLWVFLRLGMTSFGGPIAHLAYFRAEFVERRKWLDEAAYADIIALCQFLPGPASSQAGMILGMIRAGLPGGFAAWLGFTIPSALALAAFAHGVGHLGDIKQAAWLHGLKIAAAAVVAQAVWRMGQNFCRGRERATLAAAAMLLILAIPSAAGQIGAIAAGGLIGWRFLPSANNAASLARNSCGTRRCGCFPRSVRNNAVRAAAACNGNAEPHSRAHQQLLPLGRARLWRRPCRAALAAAGGRAARLDQQ
jgi:chromate transport protein ChrA